ncbi:MAG TPA: hypothetical protein VNQ73_14385 [Ilumatobacter sp.]|nr:hypothetical protein [Ilumatobacter sp.]
MDAEGRHASAEAADAAAHIEGLVNEYGYSDGAVVVPARVAALMLNVFRVDQRRVELRGQDAELDRVLLALTTVGRVYVERYGNKRGSRVDSSPALSRCSSVGAEARSQRPRKSSHAERAMTAQDAADVVGITAHGIRLAAREGRLAGEVDDLGHWTFDPDDVSAFTLLRKDTR